jgi:hypothetical protein
MNPHRAEAVIKIGTKSYTVALTIGALAMIAPILCVSTFADFAKSMETVPLDKLPGVVKALLAGNGHPNVTEDDIGSLDFIGLMTDTIPKLFAVAPNKPAVQVVTVSGGAHPPSMPHPAA